MAPGPERGRPAGLIRNSGEAAWMRARVGMGEFRRANKTAGRTVGGGR